MKPRSDDYDLNYKNVFKTIVFYYVKMMGINQNTQTKHKYNTKTKL